MNKDLIKISWIEDGVTHEWIRVFHYDDPKHPERKYAYKEQNPHTYWFDGHYNDLQKVMAYLWENVISVSAIIENNLAIVVEKGD